MTSPVPAAVLISSSSGRFSLTASSTKKISSEPWFGPVAAVVSGERQLALGRHLGGDVERVWALALERVVLVVERVDDRVLARRGPSDVGLVLDRQEDAEVGGAGLEPGWPTRYSASSVSSGLRKRVRPML